MNIQTIHQRFNLLTVAILVTVFALSIVLSATSQPVHAQANDATQLTLSPTSTRLEIAPGKTYDGSFTIFNSGKKPISFKVYAAPYQVEDENYKPTFSNSGPRTQISRWVSFEKENYSVQPGKEASVDYTITVPDSIPDGGQYAALFAQTKGQTEGSITSIKRVGMLLYAHAKGTTQNSGSSTVEPIGFWHSSPTFKVVQKITNDGNTDFDAKVELTVKDLFGNVTYSTDKTSTVLPDTTRRVPLEWKNVPPLGIFTAVSSATVLGETVKTSQLVLFTTPTALFAVITLLILIIAGVVYGIKKRRSKPSLNRR